VPRDELGGQLLWRQASLAGGALQRVEGVEDRLAGIGGVKVERVQQQREVAPHRAG